MMCIISKTISLSSVFFLVIPMISFNPAYASLVDTSQNQAFESRPANSIKLAAVHFITNDNSLNFGNQQFNQEQLCLSLGYSKVSCKAGEVRLDECPYNSDYARGCINPDTWCKNNGYNVTSCPAPRYPQNLCPYSDSYFKDCKADTDKACKEAGYGLGCETGKVTDSAQSCPYDSAHKKCVCNPCSGYAYTAEQASAQGYVPGEVCNSCGTMKYKRTANECSGYQSCDCGGTAGAKVCYSGTAKKFSSCEECKCEPSCYSRPYCENWQYSVYEDDGCGSSCLVCYDGKLQERDEWYCQKSLGTYHALVKIFGRCIIREKITDYGHYNNGSKGWTADTMTECETRLQSNVTPESVNWHDTGYCNENGDRIDFVQLK